MIIFMEEIRLAGLIVPHGVIRARLCRYGAAAPPSRAESNNT